MQCTIGFMLKMMPRFHLCAFVRALEYDYRRTNTAKDEPYRTKKIQLLENVFSHKTHKYIHNNYRHVGLKSW